MRYEIVHYFGGYYFDVDFIFKKSLGNFFDNFAFVVCKENHITYGDKIYCNALFASVPQHALLPYTHQPYFQYFIRHHQTQ